MVTFGASRPRLRASLGQGMEVFLQRITAGHDPRHCCDAKLPWLQ
jgi:hypothetical protein